MKATDGRVIPDTAAEYPGRPLRAYARHTDPDTSHDAAASVKHIRISQRCVLAVLRTHSPLTDEELVTMYEDARRRFQVFPPQSPSGIRTRRAELVKQGLVEYTGTKRPLASGRMAQTWQVTHAGSIS